MTTKRLDAARQFARLRAQARAVLLTQGTAIAPGSQKPKELCDLAADLVTHEQPSLSRETDALYARVGDRDLSIAISDHAGRIMAAYEDAGYWLGIAMGLEMATLALGVGTPQQTTKRGRR